MSHHPPALSLPGLVHHFAGCTPEREALVAGDRRLTYRSLERAAASAAAGLRALGIARGDRVGVLMGNRAEWVIGTLAANALGATVVALNTWWTPHEIEYALDHSEASCLLADTRYLKREYAVEIEQL